MLINNINGFLKRVATNEEVKPLDATIKEEPELL